MSQDASCGSWVRRGRGVQNAQGVLNLFFFFFSSRFEQRRTQADRPEAATQTDYYYDYYQNGLRVKQIIYVLCAGWDVPSLRVVQGSVGSSSLFFIPASAFSSGAAQQHDFYHEERQAPTWRWWPSGGWDSFQLSSELRFSLRPTRGIWIKQTILTGSLTSLYNMVITW